MHAKRFTAWAILAILGAQAFTKIASAQSNPEPNAGSHKATIFTAQQPATTNAVAYGLPRLKLAASLMQPVRSRRPYKIATTAGFNGLVGVGGQLSYHFNPYFAFETGLGVGSQAAPKVGFRLRSNFSAHELSPFVGVGATYVFAYPKHSMRFSAVGEAAPVAPEAETMGHAILGLSDTWSNGFTLEAGVGYARLLSRGHHGHEHKGENGLTTKRPAPGSRSGGPLMEVTVGYSF